MDIYKIISISSLVVSFSVIGFFLYMLYKDDFFRKCLFDFRVSENSRSDYITKILLIFFFFFSFIIDVIFIIYLIFK